MKLKLIILSVTVLMLSASQVFAGGGHDHGGHNETTSTEDKGSMMEHKGSMADGEITARVTESGAIKVGNTICPLSNEKVGEMGDVVEYEHEGKIYNFCCTMCLKDFKKDPDKYVKIVNEMMAAEEAEEGHETDEGHEAEKGHTGHVH